MKQAEQAYVSGIYLVVVIDGQEVAVGRALREAGLLVVDGRSILMEHQERIVHRLALNW